jgi:hypothetical protein
MTTKTETGGYGRSGGYKAPKLELTPPTTVTNATSKGTYNQAQAWAGSAQRPGCMQFMACPSRGIGA